MYRHTQDPRSIMLKCEVLVGKGFGSVNGGAAGAVAVEEVTALTHEVLNLQ